MVRNTIAAASVVVLSLCAFPAVAQPYGSAAIVIETAPPPPRYEVVPAPRRNMVWVPGHWEWRGHRHVWINGHWLKARPGYRYHPPVWEQRDGRWLMRPGNWDRDHDGIPNRYDSTPNGGRPYGDRDRDGIPNRYDRDRDGDGIRNRDDRTPDGRPRPYGDRDRDGVPNRNDWDRDGDGVPNRRDAQPDNPRRN